MRQDSLPVCGLVQLFDQCISLEYTCSVLLKFKIKIAYDKRLVDKITPHPLNMLIKAGRDAE